MRIEATLLELMETWPLQLTIETDGGRRHVDLTMETTLYVGGTEASVAGLRPGQRLLLEGTPTERGLLCHRIDVLEGGPVEGSAARPDDE